MTNDERLAETRKEDADRVQRAVEELGEHFDTVHIFTTRHMPVEAENAGAVITTNKGSGNWLARFGQVREWMVFEDERIREHARWSEQERRREAGGE